MCLYRQRPFGLQYTYIVSCVHLHHMAWKTICLCSSSNVGYRILHTWICSPWPWWTLNIPISAWIKAQWLKVHIFIAEIHQLCWLNLHVSWLNMLNRVKKNPTCLFLNPAMLSWFNLPQASAWLRYSKLRKGLDSNHNLQLISWVAANLNGDRNIFHWKTFRCCISHFSTPIF